MMTRGGFIRRSQCNFLLLGVICFSMLSFMRYGTPRKQEQELNTLIATIFRAAAVDPEQVIEDNLGLNHRDVKSLTIINETRLESIYKEKYQSMQAEPLKTSDLCPVKLSDSANNVSVYREYAPLKMLENLGFNVKMGGTYTPNCKPRQKIAIIIPFRNREEHLSVWLLHLHSFLQKQPISYTVFIINQVANCTFNKGVLMNSGFMEAAKIDRFDCFVFHDVDLLPQDNRIRYTCTDEGVRHLAYALEEWNYQELYGSLVGGAVAATWRQYIQANGYSNQFFGWGGEDDDFYLRLVRNKVNIVRYPVSIAHYTMVQHHRDVGNTVNKQRYKLLRSALTTRMQDRDGLNNLVYSVQSIEKLPLFTRINILFTEQEVKAAKPYPLQFPYLNHTLNRLGVAYL